MGGPFMQGIVLMGIIYWYSKGMLSLINEYYRSEFHQKLKRAPPEHKMYQLQPQSYDLDDMEQLIKIESLKDMNEENDYNQEVNKDKWNASESKQQNHCYISSLKVQFFDILLQFLKNYHTAPGHRFFSKLDNNICLLKDKSKT